MNQATGHPTHQEHKTSKSKIIVIIIASVLFVASIAAASFFYLQYKSIKDNPNSVNQEKTTQLTQKVGKLYKLPDETPTIASITDKDKLKSQPFFKNAENGDQLLIYPKTKLAIIYRESSNIIINVGPITLSDSDAKAGDASKASETTDGTAQ